MAQTILMQSGTYTYTNSNSALFCILPLKFFILFHCILLYFMSSGYEENDQEYFIFIKSCSQGSHTGCFSDEMKQARFRMKQLWLLNDKLPIYISSENFEEQAYAYEISIIYLLFLKLECSPFSMCLIPTSYTNITIYLHNFSNKYFSNPIGRYLPIFFSKWKVLKIPQVHMKEDGIISKPNVLRIKNKNNK